MRDYRPAESTVKNWELILAIAGAVVLGLSSLAISTTELPHHDSLLTAGDCHMPATVLETRGQPHGTALLFHGLAADRRIMQGLGDYLATKRQLRVYLFDLPGHGDNTDSFSFARADGCARGVVRYMIHSGEIDPRRTILIGHSMGGTIAIRIADGEPLAGTIAISPAPTPLPRRMPANLLIFSAQFDLPTLQNAARDLAQAAGGERTKTDDFVEARAFHLEITPFSDHTSLLADPRVLEQAGNWSDDVLRSSAAKNADLAESNENHRSPTSSFGLSYKDHPRLSRYARIAPYVGCVAALMLFPLCLLLAAKVADPLTAESLVASPSAKLAIIEGAVCALTTALILAWFVPLRFLDLYAGDYLASLLLIAGLLLLALNWKTARQSFHPNFRMLVAATALGFAVMLGIGAWLDWQTADLWMNAPRWQRFAELLPVTSIFCFAEEVILGPVASGWQRAARFGLSLIVRTELWLACLLAYYRLASGQVLILVLVVSLALFSVLQRLAADAWRQRTGSATASALFGAILAAWFIAAVFPLT